MGSALIPACFCGIETGLAVWLSFESRPHITVVAIAVGAVVFFGLGTFIFTADRLVKTGEKLIEAIKDVNRENSSES